MPLASRMGVFAILLKHEAIRLGTLRRRLLYTVQCSVFLLFSSLIRVRPWITKTPLLKALSAIDQAATEVARYFDKNVSKVTCTLGV